MRACPSARAGPGAGRRFIMLLPPASRERGPVSATWRVGCPGGGGDHALGLRQPSPPPRGGGDPMHKPVPGHRCPTRKRAPSPLARDSSGRAPRTRASLVLKDSWGCHLPDDQVVRLRAPAPPSPRPPEAELGSSPGPGLAAGAAPHLPRAPTSRPPGSALLLRPRPGPGGLQAAAHPPHRQPLRLQALPEPFILLQGQEEFFF